MKRIRPWLWCGWMTCAAMVASAQSTAPGGGSGAPSRGALLYDTHCIACHTSQMHWRDKRQVTDWSSLRMQVRRWQATAQLGWSDRDVNEVARHLNATIYRFPAEGERLGRAPHALRGG